MYSDWRRSHTATGGEGPKLAFDAGLLNRQEDVKRVSHHHHGFLYEQFFDELDEFDFVTKFVKPAAASTLFCLGGAAAGAAAASAAGVAPELATHRAAQLATQLAMSAQPAGALCHVLLLSMALLDAQ